MILEQSKFLFFYPILKYRFGIVVFTRICSDARTGFDGGMEKLLDRPRAFEESKFRYFLALESQKRAQILVISNAQRKLVSSFQQKLQATASISRRHLKLMQGVEIAKQKAIANEKGFMEKLTRSNVSKEK